MDYSYFNNESKKSMDLYYSREKIYNILGIAITMFFIFQGWELIFSPAQILVLLLARVFYMRREGKIQSVLFLLLLYIGYLGEYHYLIIKHFEYIVLAFFFVFLIYYIHKSSSTTKLREMILLTLSIAILLSFNIYMSNNRLFKDPQLQKIVNKRYESQLRQKPKLVKEDPRLENIINLDIRSKFGVKTLAGIESLPNIRNLNIDRQDKLLDYSNLARIENLKRIHISDPHPEFSINNLPQLKELESLSIYLGMNQFLTDGIIKLDNFPQLKSLMMFSMDDRKPITIDITKTPNIETIDVGVNVEKIIGLEKAENLKSIFLYLYGSDDYKDEIKRVRPDIELR